MGWRVGDVILMPTPEHTPGLQSVIIEDGDGRIFCAGDTSYTQELLERHVIDGVATSDAAESTIQQRILALAQTHPVVYLPRRRRNAWQRAKQSRNLPWWHNKGLQ